MVFRLDHKAMVVRPIDVFISVPLSNEGELRARNTGRQIGQLDRKTARPLRS